MSFNTAILGLKAAQEGLNVTSNNIANVNTVGFKSSRPEFGDVFAQTVFGTGEAESGNGVFLNRVAQQFDQGSLVTTGRALDLAIDGNGFFVLGDENIDSQSRIFSRAGIFSTDRDGFIVNGRGEKLMGFPVDVNGNASSVSVNSTIPLLVPPVSGSPEQTTEVEIGVNLPANEAGLDPLAFDSGDLSTFNKSTSLSVFDSLGSSHSASVFFVKDQAVDNQWLAYVEMDGNPVDIQGGVAGSNGQLAIQMQFDGNTGQLTATTPTNITTVPIDFGNGSNNAQTITFDFANNDTTQFATPFVAKTLGKDGFSQGEFSSLEIANDGLVIAKYSNGQSLFLGQIAMARFNNPQGLQQLGNAAWAETRESGEAIPGLGGIASFGFVKSGNLEDSTVDITRELVDLISMQRNFQANSKSIETMNAITQTVLQLT